MLQRFERLVLRGARLVESRLVREPGVAVREIDEAALFAALRDDDPHAPAGPIREPALERVPLVGLRGQVNLRRRAADLVELLHGGDQNLALRSIRRSHRRSRARCARRPGRPGPGTPGPPRRRDRASSRTHRGARVPPSPSSADDRGASGSSASRRAIARPLRSARRPPRRACGVRSWPVSSSFRPSRKSLVMATAPAYSSGVQIVSTQGAMQRLMSYSRHGRLRFPVMTSLHDRMPNNRCVSAIVLRAKCAGRNGPA